MIPEASESVFRRHVELHRLELAGVFLARKWVKLTMDRYVILDTQERRVVAHNGPDLYQCIIVVLGSANQLCVGSVWCSITHVRGS